MKKEIVTYENGIQVVVHLWGSESKTTLKLVNGEIIPVNTLE